MNALDDLKVPARACARRCSFFFMCVGGARTVVCLRHFSASPVPPKPQLATFFFLFPAKSKAAILRAPGTVCRQLRNLLRALPHPQQRRACPVQNPLLTRMGGTRPVVVNAGPGADLARAPKTSSPRLSSPPSPGHLPAAPHFAGERERASAARRRAAAAHERAAGVPQGGAARTGLEARQPHTAPSKDGLRRGNSSPTRARRNWSSCGPSIQC